MLTKFEETLTFSEKKIILVISHTTNFTQIVFNNLFSIFSLPWISGQLLETNYYTMVGLVKYLETFWLNCFDSPCQIFDSNTWDYLTKWRYGGPRHEGGGRSNWRERLLRPNHRDQLLPKYQHERTSGTKEIYLL